MVVLIECAGLLVK